jgi:tetratricopeptide (TPR) repeat protein
MRYLFNSLILVIFLIAAGCSTSDFDTKINHLILQNNQEVALNLVNQQIKKNSENPTLYYQKSKILLSLERYGEAIKAINHSLVLKPGIPEYRFEAGKNYYFSGDYFNSISQFKSAVFLDADLIQAYYYLALSYHKVGKTEEAVKFLNIVINIEPLYFDALLLQSELKFQIIQTDDEAMKQILALNEVLKLHPGSIAGNILLSDLYFQSGNSFKAKQVLEKSYEVNPHNGTLVKKLAEYYINSGLYDRADKLVDGFESADKTLDVLSVRISYYTKKDTDYSFKLAQLLKEFPENPELQFIQGLSLFDQKEFVAAESSFQKVLSLKPDFAEAYLYLSRISEHQKDIASEQFYIEKAFSINPQNRDILFKYLEMIYNSGDMIELENIINKYDAELEYSYSKFYQAIIYKSRGNYSKALSLLKIVSNSEYSFRVETQLADMDIERGYYQSAEKRLNLILKESPSLLDAILTKAKLLFRTQKIADVITFLKQFESVQRAKGAIHLLLSDALMQSGQIETAIEVLNSAYDMWPEHVEIAQVLSVLLETRGQLKAAIRILEPLQSFEHKFNQLFHYRLVGLYLKTEQQQKMQEYLLRYNIKKELSFQNSYLSNFIFKRLNTCDKP